MRICFVSQEFPPDTAAGGIGTQTHAKARGMAALGHDVHVISATPGNTRNEYELGPIHVIRIPTFHARMQIYSECVAWLTYSGEVAAAVAALDSYKKLDLVDFPEWGGEGYVHLLNQTEWNRIPTVVHLHGPLVMFAHTMSWPELNSDLYRVGSMMERECLHRANAVYSSSACSAEWCARHYGLDLAQIQTLHTGVDTDLFRPGSESKETRQTILFAGRLDRSKGVESLVEAACILAPEFPGLQLRLIGRGKPSFVSELTEKASRYGVPDLVVFSGYCPREELPLQLSRAHVFAAPSIYEGGPGFVYLEAMACGLPVIACQGSGVSEVVEHERTGLLVPPAELQQLVEALRRLLLNESYREELGRNGHEFVSRNFDERSCIQRLEQFYRAVVSRKYPTSLAFDRSCSRYSDVEAQSSAVTEVNA